MEAKVPLYLLSELTNIQDTTIRRDFTYLSKTDNFGQRGKGYDVKHLIDGLSEVLGLGLDESIISIIIALSVQQLIGGSKSSTLSNLLTAISIAFLMGNHIYDLPIPLDDDSYNFSFSGLKSAVINLNHKAIVKLLHLIKILVYLLKQPLPFHRSLIQSLKSMTSLHLHFFNH